MIDWTDAPAILSDNKHQWVKFYNPRNKRVRISACAKCGIAQGPISNSVTCENLMDAEHRMKKMGWEEARLKSVS